jgi:hypothetical protein
MAAVILTAVLVLASGCLSDAADKDFDFDNPSDTTPDEGDDETGQLVISYVDDASNVVVIVNQSAIDETLTDWTLENDAATEVFTFSAFELQSGALARVHESSGTDDGDDLYGHGIDWGLGDDNDEANLHDETGTLVDSCSLGESCWP